MPRDTRDIASMVGFRGKEPSDRPDLRLPRSAKRWFGSSSISGEAMIAVSSGDVMAMRESGMRATMGASEGVEMEGTDRGSRTARPSSPEIRIGLCPGEKT